LKPSVGAARRSGGPWSRPRAAHIWPRVDGDWYVEPPWVAARLFDMESFTGAIHDPAAGMGRIVEAARSHGHAATGADIVDRGFGYPVADFLQTAGELDNIVTNPPFDAARAFTEHALQLARHKVAVLFDRSAQCCPVAY
jgi:hypothetical protein